MSVPPVPPPPNPPPSAQIGGRCPACGYPVTYTVNPGEETGRVTCPECGGTWTFAEMMGGRGRRPNPWMLAFFVPAALCPCLVSWVMDAGRSQIWEWFKGDLLPGDIRNNAAGERMHQFVFGVGAFGIPVLTAVLLGLGTWCALRFGGGAGRVKRSMFTMGLLTAVAVAIFTWVFGSFMMMVRYSPD